MKKTGRKPKAPENRLVDLSLERWVVDLLDQRIRDDLIQSQAASPAWSFGEKLLEPDPAELPRKRRELLTKLVKEHHGPTARLETGPRIVWAAFGTVRMIEEYMAWGGAVIEHGKKIAPDWLKQQWEENKVIRASLVKMGKLDASDE